MTAPNRPAKLFRASPPLMLPAILLAGFALRLYRLGAQSLWYDETVSAFLAGQAAPDLMAHTARDIHPPGYYLLLHLWTALAGHTEFALAYFSLLFGVLLIALTYHVARYLGNKLVATWAALLVACSPYHVWYSQEVRMYTLGAALGLAAAYCALRATFTPNKKTTVRFWLSYFVLSTMGLYALYYFVFLLIVINLFCLAYLLWPKIKRPALLGLFGANGLVLAAYLPWLPIAWRQATQPPVPPWRVLTGFWPVVLESWSALSLGQSSQPATLWPILLLTLALFLLGLVYLANGSYPATLLLCYPATLLPCYPATLLPCYSATLLFAYTFGPLLLIYFLSFITPLYHVRYIFTYSPAFYIILAAGLAWLTTRLRFWVALFAATLLLAASGYSVYQMHFNPRYQADDYRSAVNFIQAHWQPGDVILANAGYTYTAFVYYSHLPHLERRRLVPYQSPADSQHPLLLQTGFVNGDPRLGWGDPRSDFYAMSAAETTAALEHLSRHFSRLWHLRAYDTVTDPNGFIRDWLAANTIPLEDEVFAGESNIRAQGFLLAGQTELQGETVYFADGLALAGWQLPAQVWSPGETIHVKLGWQATAPPGVDYKMSLKLWAETGDLAAQGQDEWPVGRLYRATDWPPGQTIYHPAQITLPSTLPPGQYWLNVELYHPNTVQPLPRLDGSAPVVTLGPVVVK
ncbi:MAG: glycosyltransferase family 39 protein [Anaerolineae bacterium]|nr:glycosyltransferase family 39 protein [Anaerolineae bacterium]